MKFDTPIAYIIYNRAEHTRKSFEVLKKLRPSRLFIIADGPKPDNVSDISSVTTVRKITEDLNWDCRVERNYSKVNLGLKSRVSSGLDWVFEQVDKAIVLEDDCIPHPDFFKFCESLLNFYEKNDKISVITGNNFQNHRPNASASYYFTKFCHCWGWATWKRAWKKYDGNIRFWPNWSKSEGWKQSFSDDSELKYWKSIFESVYLNKIDSWAYPWTACNWYNNSLSIAPNVNLVSNIGFGADGTHTKSKNHTSANLSVFPLKNILHPRDVVQDFDADEKDYLYHFGGRNRKFPRYLVWFPLYFAKKFIKKLL